MSRLSQCDVFKAYRVLMCCTLFLLPSLQAIAQPPSAEDINKTIASAADKSIVKILALSSSETGSSQKGSGFLFNECGGVITNFHVIRDTEAIGILHPHTGIKAIFRDVSIVKVDPIHDLAYLHISNSNLLQNSLPAKLNIDHQTSKGDKVIAVTNPYIFDGYFTESTVGKVTKSTQVFTQRTALANENALYHYDIFFFQQFIDSGSSGGPIFNFPEGEVIAIATGAIGNDARYSFGIPSKYLYHLFGKTEGSPLSELLAESCELVANPSTVESVSDNPAPNSAPAMNRGISLVSSSRYIDDPYYEQLALFSSKEIRISGFVTTEDGESLADVNIELTATDNDGEQAVYIPTKTSSDGNFNVTIPEDKTYSWRITYSRERFEEHSKPLGKLSTNVSIPNVALEISNEYRTDSTLFYAEPSALLLKKPFVDKEVIIPNVSYIKLFGKSNSVTRNVTPSNIEWRLCTAPEHCTNYSNLPEWIAVSRDKGSALPNGDTITVHCTRDNIVCQQGEGQLTFSAKVNGRDKYASIFLNAQLKKLQGFLLFDGGAPNGDQILVAAYEITNSSKRRVSSQAIVDADGYFSIDLFGSNIGNDIYLEIESSIFQLSNEHDSQISIQQDKTKYISLTLK